MEDKKRLTACLVCRKRKLKCDSARPKCASCSRLGHATPQIQGADRLVDMEKVRAETRLCQETRTKISNARTETGAIGEIARHTSIASIVDFASDDYTSPNSSGNIAPSL
jgi:hypothetical protein